MSDRPRALEALWHAHPNCTVTVATDTAHVVDNATKIGIDIVLASSTMAKWSTPQVIIGQQTPVLQGWYSPNYGSYSASPVLSYQTNVSAPNNVFAWVLVPTQGGVASRASAVITSVSATEVVVDATVEGTTTTFKLSV